jgi:HAD superfamily hydrolase (TIGR01509 family)
MSTFVKACRECGFEPNIEVFHKCIGVDWDKTKEIMLAGYGRDFPLERVTELWDKNMAQETLGKTIQIKAGAFDLLKYLNEEKVKLAVVTSTHTEIAAKRLYNAKLDQFFLFVVGGDKVRKGKPDPEIYLVACRRLGEQPTNCLALEDSDNGVLVAYNAGLAIIQVPDVVQPSSEVKALGHIIVESLASVEGILRKL